jgi:hypothetical protein
MLQPASRTGKNAKSASIETRSQKGALSAVNRKLSRNSPFTNRLRYLQDALPLGDGPTLSKWSQKESNF